MLAVVSIKDLSLVLRTHILQAGRGDEFSVKEVETRKPGALLPSQTTLPDKFQAGEITYSKQQHWTQ